MKHDLRNVEIGYCGNVHPAVTVEQLIGNIESFTKPIAEKVSDDVMPFGIWLSKTALDELRTPAQIDRLRQTLHDSKLSPFTINGFPFGDFHQEVVKHSVYEPTWADPARLEFTCALATLHDRLIPAQAISTISTLPLGWPQKSGKPLAYTGKRLTLDQKADAEFLKSCAKNLLKCGTELARRYEETGRHTMICIEPEPGCVLDTAEDVCEFFSRYLFDENSTSAVERARSHIGVCHDVCHSAVMFEDQDHAIKAYRDAGIAIGKVQVSSAVEVNFDMLDPDQKQAAWASLQTFSEPKYLHQTCVRTDDEVLFFEDLSDALKGSVQQTGHWRVHFHVPVFASTLGEIGTTQACIGQCIDALFDVSDTDAPNAPQHFEVETYAWNVLPAHLQTDSLVDGIVNELQWFSRLIETRLK